MDGHLHTNLKVRERRVQFDAPIYEPVITIDDSVLM
jgi:hypothetical protein